LFILVVCRCKCLLLLFDICCYCCFVVILRIIIIIIIIVSVRSFVRSFRFVITVDGSRPILQPITCLFHSSTTHPLPSTSAAIHFFPDDTPVAYFESSFSILMSIVPVPLFTPLSMLLLLLLPLLVRFTEHATNVSP